MTHDLTRCLTLLIREYGAALKLHESVLTSLFHTFGGNHPYTVESLWALADTLRVAGRASFIDQSTTAVSLSLAVQDSAVEVTGSIGGSPDTGTETAKRSYSAGQKRHVDAVNGTAI